MTPTLCIFKGFWADWGTVITTTVRVSCFPALVLSKPLKAEQLLLHDDVYRFRGTFQ